MKSIAFLIMSLLLVTGTPSPKEKLTHFCAVQKSSVQFSSVPLNRSEALFGDRSLIPGTEFGTASLTLSGGEVKQTGFTGPTVGGTITMYRVVPCSDPNAIRLVEKRSFWGTSITLDTDWEK